MHIIQEISALKHQKSPQLRDCDKEQKPIESNDPSAVMADGSFLFVFRIGLLIIVGIGCIFYNLLLSAAQYSDYEQNMQLILLHLMIAILKRL